MVWFVLNLYYTALTTFNQRLLKGICLTYYHNRKLLTYGTYSTNCQIEWFTQHYPCMKTDQSQLALATWVIQPEISQQNLTSSYSNWTYNSQLTTALHSIQVVVTVLLFFQEKEEILLENLNTEVTWRKWGIKLYSYFDKVLLSNGWTE